MNWYVIGAILFLTGCASSGYNPHYIVSESIEEPARHDPSDLGSALE